MSTPAPCPRTCPGCPECSYEHEERVPTLEERRRAARLDADREVELAEVA